MGTPAPRSDRRRPCGGYRPDRQDARAYGKLAREASRFVLFVALAALACAVYLGLEAAAWAGLYLNGLPMGQAGLMEFDFIPVGPLAPLGMLIAEK